MARGKKTARRKPSLVKKTEGYDGTGGFIRLTFEQVEVAKKKGRKLWEITMAERADVAEVKQTTNGLVQSTQNA